MPKEPQQSPDPAEIPFTESRVPVACLARGVGAVLYRRLHWWRDYMISTLQPKEMRMYQM